MVIPIHLPHAFGPGSNPVDSQRAAKVIHEYGRRLELRSGKWPSRCYFREGNYVMFDLERVFVAGSSLLENARVLRVLLDMMVALNIAYAANHPTPNLYRSGVVYGRTTAWETMPAMLERGYADCKSLSSRLVAEYRLAGRNARSVFRHNPRSKDSGTAIRDFHILVQTDEGFEDPSKVLGMGQNENARH